ncbi:MAG: S9 family peptidase [Chitinophagaceae bacterium]|nr:MAG: S9 family peptidase [Chitinophagaceae bacterium]
MRRLLLIAFAMPMLAVAQQKMITLEDIYKKGTFRGESVPGFSTPAPDSLLASADIRFNNKKLDASDNQFSPGNKYVLVFAGREFIYRRSSRAYTYLYDLTAKTVRQIDTARLMHASFSPDGSKLAYVKDNNLYWYDITSGVTKAITTDGKWNEVINGNSDWVYEEEFSLSKAYSWSPEGNYIAFYRFDESKVREYEFTQFDNLYNNTYSYKYPKAGEANSTVQVFIYNLAKSISVPAQYDQGDIYIPLIKWTANDGQLVVFHLNRHQDDLRLLLTDAATGTSSLLYEEKNKYYVDIKDDWLFTEDGKQLLFTSEKSGFMHIWIRGMDGKSETQISKGNFDVSAIEGIDLKNKKVYYSMAWPTPMDRNLFVTDFSGKNTTRLTNGSGWHRISLNSDYTRFYDFLSDINTPQQVTLYKIGGSKTKPVATQVRVVNESSKLKNTLAQFALGKAEFARIPNSKGDTLNAWILKPAGFNPSVRYPVLFCNYGGPGSQQVTNRYGAVTMWQQLLSQKGFVIVSLDNTGTGFRGEEFKKKTYLQLGKLEIEDQIDGAKYMASQPWVDAKKIGHYGWSYGGFMSSLAITKGNAVFSAAVAVAPVTNWRFYDNIYTERYMRTPQENPDGYDQNSPLNFTQLVKGKFLLIHGTADDNVHFQNSTQMVSALVRNNIDFESAYYPNKNHGISGTADNTSYHLWSRMVNWIITNLGNETTVKGVVK